MLAAQPSDADLVEAARVDRAAFDGLYRRYLPGVYRYVLGRLGNVQDAEDVTAATFMEALQGLGGYQEQGRFPAWLFTIARRQAMAHVRRLRPTADIAAASEARAPEGTPIETLDAVMSGLSALDDDDRDAIALRFMADLPVAEVAAILGKGESATKMQLHRALRRMRTALEPGHGD